MVYPQWVCGVGAWGYIGYLAATDSCYLLVFASICSSEMSICSSLVALGHVWYLTVSIPDPCCLSYFDGSVLQSTTDEDCLFLHVRLIFSHFYYKVGVISCNGIFLRSSGTFMSACRRILRHIAVLPLFWHARIFKLFSLYMLKMRICEMN